MSTVYNEFDQGDGPAVIWPFRIYHLFGSPGQMMVVKAERPMRRDEYYNAVSIVRGHIDCEQPDGSSVRWDAGMVDLELPPYPMPGSYKLRPGPEGVEFFCASKCCANLASRVLRRRLIMPSPEERAMFPVEHLVVLVSGSVELDGETIPAPMIIGPRREPTYPIFRNAHGVVLWLD